MINNTGSLNESYPAVQSTSSMGINKVTKEMLEKTAQIGNNAANLNIKVKETKSNEPPPSTSSMGINRVTKEMQEKTAQIGNDIASLTGRGGKLNIFA